jgi:plasmid maintenance system antidote protein VapI
MPRHAIHPGEHLAEQLEAFKMSAAKLAGQLRVGDLILSRDAVSERGDGES